MNPEETITEGHTHEPGGNHHTCMNPEETIPEGHMHESEGNHHGRSHA